MAFSIKKGIGQVAELTKKTLQTTIDPRKQAQAVGGIIKDPAEAVGKQVVKPFKTATNMPANWKKVEGGTNKAGGQVAEQVKAPFSNAADWFKSLGISGDIEGLLTGMRGDTGNTGQPGGVAPTSATSALGFQLQEASPLSIDRFAKINPSQLQAVTIANPGRFGVNAYAGRQDELLALLQAQASGQGGPSPAELMLKANQEDQLRQQMALAATLGGRAAPTAQRQLMQQQAMGGQDALRQAAIMRAQEQLQAQGLYSGALEGARGQEFQQQSLLADVERANQAAWQAANMENAKQAFEAQTFGQQQELARIREQEAAEQARRNTLAQLEIARGTRDVTLMTAEADRLAAERASKRQMAGSLIGGVAAAAAKAKGG